MPIARVAATPARHRTALDRRRALLQGATALTFAPWLLRHARAADVPRFALGIASGQPRADSVVLWTRLTGAGLPDRVAVQWEIARDEAFRDITAHGEETAEAAWAHSVHAEPVGLEPARWYWYRFRALGQPSMVGRTRTAPAPHASATLDFAITSCQRFDVGHYAAWRHVAGEELDLVLFLGDYIYEYPSKPNALRPVEGGPVRTLEQYRARYATHKSDPALQAAHAAAPWLLVWDDHEVGNDYAGLQGQDLEPDFAARRASAYRAYWEHMPFPKSARPIDADMRITGRLDWGRLARIHLLDDRQYRDPQVCPKPGRAGSNTVTLQACPELFDPQRTLLGAAQEQWLAQGWDLTRPWNLLAQQTLMARYAWSDPARGDGSYWTDGWDGYPAARLRLLDTVARRQVPGVVVLGGDVHANYVADLKADFDDTASPVLASEFCGTSITSLALPQPRIDAARAFNPHVRYGRGDQRGYMRFRLDAKQLQMQVRVLDNVLDPASGITTAARFMVDAQQPGALPA
ncbi:MAG: alkaline phosphatase D family protein [Burkholderiales bacterium]|nr:alkaline phosphatase D family protein [Burkholderiales bacterium]